MFSKLTTIISQLFHNFHKTWIHINFQVIPKKNLLFFNLISNCFEECFSGHKRRKASDIVIKIISNVIRVEYFGKLVYENLQRLVEQKVLIPS